MASVSLAQTFENAADLCRGIVDTYLAGSEGLARVSRVCIDETLGVEQDVAQAVRRTLEETEFLLSPEAAEPNPAAFLARAGDAARSSAFLWVETGLKAQERVARVAQSALSELGRAQGGFRGRKPRARSHDAGAQA